MSPGRLRKRTKKEQKRRRQLDLERRVGLLGVRCRICGEGPFVKVGGHTRQMHGVSSAEYRRRFPDAEMTHPDLKPAWVLEMKAAGRGPGQGRKRSRRCQRGHAMRGDNVVESHGRRWCKRCRWEAIQRRREASGTKLCECGCGTEIYALTAMLKPARFVDGSHPRFPKK